MTRTGLDGASRAPRFDFEQRHVAAVSLHRENPYRLRAVEASSLAPAPTVTLQDLDALVARRLDDQAAALRAQAQEELARAWEAGLASGHREGFRAGIDLARAQVADIVREHLATVSGRLRCRAAGPKSTVARDRAVMTDAASSLDVAMKALEAIGLEG